MVIPQSEIDFKFDCGNLVIMKCPKCEEEMLKLEGVPFTQMCKICGLHWVIQTFDESIAMGALNTELLARNDLTHKQKLDMIIAKANELESNRNR